MKKLLVIISLLIVAAACSTAPTNQPAPSANTNSAETSATMTEADAIAKEKATWEALEKKDYDGYGNMLTSDFIEVLDDGVFDKAGSVADSKDFTVTDTRFSGWKMLPIDKDAVILMYDVSYKGTYKGQDVPPGPYRASAVWTNRDGKWLAVYYQQTLAKTGPPPPPATTPAAKSSASPAKTAEPSTGIDQAANEKMVWDTLKRKDYAAFASFLDDAQVEVEAEGVTDKAGTVKGVQMFDASKYELSNFKTVKIDSNASLVTYVAKPSGPKAVPARHSTIWVNRDGKWRALFHQGTPEMPAPAMAAPTAPVSSSPKAATSPAAKASPAMKAPAKKV
jgi:hypothetical protein